MSCHSNYSVFLASLHFGKYKAASFTCTIYVLTHVWLGVTSFNLRVKPLLKNFATISQIIMLRQLNWESNTLSSMLAIFPFPFIEILLEISRPNLSDRSVLYYFI